MSTNGDRRLIEDYLPIDAISEESSREKSIRKGHISTLHVWWARRPLVACRGALYGALVPASRYIPANGSSGESGDDEAEKRGRDKAREFVAALCKYPGLPSKIAEARQHILEDHAERLSRETGRKVTVDDIEAHRAPRPRVLDMFAGGGSIPLEALRLGCQAYALDLNPVAHIVELCALVYPQKYGKPDPSARGITGPRNMEGETTWGGLGEEVRYWGQWVLNQVRAEIGDLYPLIPDLSATPVRQRLGASQLEFGGQDFAKTGQQELATEQPSAVLTPVVYLWTRTVSCKNPACRAIVPLVRQTWLCQKDKRYVALRVVAPRGLKRVRFEVVEAVTQEGLGFDPEAFSKAGNATCPFCGTVADSDYVKAEGCARRMGQQMMAVACIRHGRQGKVYLSAEDLLPFVPDDKAINQRIEALCARTGLTMPTEPITTDAKNSCWTHLYGIANFGELFTSRQMLSLLTFSNGVRQAEKTMRAMGCDEGRTKAVATSLSCVLDKQADANSSLCRLEPSGGRGIHGTFARQALPMVWDFAEANPLNTVIACWESLLREAVGNLLDLVAGEAASVTRGSASSLPWPDGFFDAVITDPPYYDNVPYADLSDFFYVWLKRTIGHLYLEHFASGGTPKRNEAVADAVRHNGDRDKAKRAYEATMAQCLAEAHRVLKPGGHMTVVYAHKTTLGWSTLVDALRRARFTVTEAWPLDTETSGRLRARDSAALASSIFLVARKRENAQAGSHEEVHLELELIVRERVNTLWQMGISGADLVIAAVGAGLRAFTRFERVEYANGEEVPAERFLAEVEGVVLETLLERIFSAPRSGLSAVDSSSRFYVLWRFTYRAVEVEAGEAIVFAYPQDVELSGPRSLTVGPRALLTKKGNKYCLRDFAERGADEKLGLPNETTLTPPLIDVLHRALWLMEHHPASLPDFLDQARPNTDHLRLVAQALAGPALQGGGPRTSRSTEQTALATMLANWRNLVEENLFRQRS